MAFDITKIKQEKTKQLLSKKKTFLEKEITLFSRSFTNKAKEDFYCELSVLLYAGVNLKEALELLCSSQKKEYNKKIIDTIIKRIISGESLSACIKNLKPFTSYEYYSLKIGEETGRTAQITKQLGTFFSRKNEQYRHLINSLTYPAIIVFTAIIVVVFMLRFIVPIFQDIFQQQNMQLPTITLFIISLSEKLHKYGWLILLAIISVLIGIQLAKENPKYLKTRDFLLSKIPFIGDFVRTIYLSQFSQALALLAASKVPVVYSIKLAKQMIHYYPLRKALSLIEVKLLKGQPLSLSLSEHKIFDDKMIALVKVAEETNQTQHIFERLNLQYSSKVEQRSKVLSTILEPIIILIIGAFVGLILIAMYLPMFELSNMMG